MNISNRTAYHVLQKKDIDFVVANLDVFFYDDAIGNFDQNCDSRIQPSKSPLMVTRVLERAFAVLVVIYVNCRLRAVGGAECKQHKKLPFGRGER